MKDNNIKISTIATDEYEFGYHMYCNECEDDDIKPMSFQEWLPWYKAEEAYDDWVDYLDTCWINDENPITYEEWVIKNFS